VSGWDGGSINHVSETQMEDKVTRSVSSTLTVGKVVSINSTQTETMEVRMKKSFTQNLKRKCVVGLPVLTMLGVCGVCLTQPHTSSMNQFD